MHWETVEAFYDSWQERVHVFECFGGFKFLANVLHYECLHSQDELLGTC